MKYLTYFLVFIMCASWGQANPVPNTLDDITLNINIDNKRSHKQKPATNYAPPEDYKGDGNEEDYEGTSGALDIPDCTCLEYTNPFGFGQCKQGHYLFGGKPMCYVKILSNCNDLQSNNGTPERLMSASACVNYGRLWRKNGQCGHKFPLATGEPTQCDPTNELGNCCSDEGWCGHSTHHCDCPNCVNYGGGQSRVARGSTRAGCFLQGICANKRTKVDYSQRKYDRYGCTSQNACSNKNACFQRAVKTHKFCDNSMEQTFNAIFVDKTGVETVYSHPKGR